MDEINILIFLIQNLSWIFEYEIKIMKRITVFLIQKTFLFGRRILLSIRNSFDIAHQSYKLLQEAFITKKNDRKTMVNYDEKADINEKGG